ncbi:MAG: pilus assembly protein [Acidobacteriota bacterium]|nr:pilus assembly protein [Acidobacteriota bacterium]
MMVSLANLFHRKVEPTASWSRCVPPARRRDWWRREDGSTLIEFAVTLPTLFALIFVFIEICLMLYTYEMISECARQGTRYAMVRGASCPNIATPTCEVNAAAVSAYVSGLKWPNVGGGTMTPVTTYPDGNENANSHVQVKVTYTYHLMLPFVPNKSFSLSSTSITTIIQ